MSTPYISNYSAKYEDSVMFYRLGDNGLIWRAYKMVNSFTVLSGFSRGVRTFRTIYQNSQRTGSECQGASRKEMKPGGSNRGY